MPSPFPGMDPWLESPTEWPGFHYILVVTTVEVLQPQRRAKGYYANPGERVWLMEPPCPICPDVALMQHVRRPVPATSVELAVLEPDEPLRVPAPSVEVHESFVEIFDAADNRLVTGIEFVSPANKVDYDGRRLYQLKQQEMREAGVHLVEVDLIRRGPHVLDIPRRVVEDAKPWDYLVNLARRGSRELEFYAIPMQQRLPRIRVPLKSGNGDATLDLQLAFTRSYEIGPYPERLDYASAPPDPPLGDELARWANDLLTAKGFR
jgi:uncharacterized protein DUF4058